MDDLDDYQKHRKAAESRRRKNDVRKPQQNNTGGGFRSFLIKATIVLTVLSVMGMVMAYAAFEIITAKYRKWADEFNLEDINNLDHPCIIYDRNGEEIGRIYDENRSYVTLDMVSDAMINALVAQEDKTFWTHKGYDPVGIARAAKEAFLAKGSANQGASTITQQLARGAYDLEARTSAMGGSRYERKIVEIFLAMRIEKKYSKRQIIEFYLNRIYFGRGYHGIRAAALGYFGKEPRDLTIREAASLAALIKNPENYNPIRNFDLNYRWRNDVIDRMQRWGYLTLAEAERVKKLPMVLNPKPLRRQTSFLYALVQNQAISIFQNPERGEEIVKSAGLKIHTTIDKQMQLAAENALKAKLEEIEDLPDYDHVRFDDRDNPDCAKHRYVDGVVYALDNKTGGTLVYVGGRNFDRDNFNIIESGKRPVGTALLPFLYACAFDNGYSPCSRLIDDAMDNRLSGIGGAEGVLGEWGMEVDKGRYLDSVTVRQALEWSKIAASARLGIALSSSRTGSRAYINTLQSVGITPPPRNPGSTEVCPQYYPRVYLGTEPVSMKEMVQAYTVFPNGGERPRHPYIITRITDSNGSVIWEEKEAVTAKMKKSMEPCTAFRVHSIMQGSLKDGSAVRVRHFLPDSFNGAVKSGTNYDFADNALFGYSNDFTCGVWVGFLNDRTAIYPGAFGSDTCAPILGAVFHAADGRYPNEPIPMPEDTEEVEICRHSGQLASNFCFEAVSQDGQPKYVRTTYREYFPKGDSSPGVCSVHGDGSPSLGDLLELGMSRMGASRVLPVLPVLPTGSPLLGDDPYECDTQLNPRYKTSDDLAQADAASMNAAQFSTGDTLDPADTVPENSTLELPVPRPIRAIPIPPVNL